MEDSKPKPLDELKKQVIAQKKVFLPPEPEDEELEPLHQAVTGYDEVVSQLVFGAIQGFPVAIPDQQIQEHQAAVLRLLALPQIQTNRKAEFYRSYASRLGNMLQLAQQVLTERHPKGD